MILNIVNNCAVKNSVSPITLCKLYQSIIIPRALYGCETWNMYSKMDIERLEIVHRYCDKHMQQFQMHFATDYSLSLLNLTNIETMIDYRKLQLLGQLYRLPCKYLAKEIFNIRLIRYVNQ